MKIKRTLQQLFPILIAALLGINGWSQETGEDRLGSWWMVFANHRVSDDLSIHSEIQYRTFEFSSNFNQLLLRTGLTYHLSKNSSVTLGYGNIPTDASFEDFEGEKNSKENRIYQEFATQQQVGAFQLSHRYRLEQRFLENPQGNKDTQHRARYLLRLTYPLSDKWFLTAYDELFINLQEPIFGQNRLYGALGFHLNNSTSFQLGYLKNHFTGINFDRFQLSAWFKFDYRKTKPNESG